MISEHSDFYVPNLYTFQNGNTYFGSFHGLRFRLSPGKRGEEGSEESVLEAVTWYGLFCFELSEVVDEGVFPMSEEGHGEMLRWLDDQYQKMCARQKNNETNETNLE
jgi:hypothetical protein